MRHKTISTLLLLLLATLVVMYYFKGCLQSNPAIPAATAFGPQAVIDNYGADIRHISVEFGIAPEYLAALCMLESGGRMPVPSRFEKHVYARLKLVQLGVKSSYEHVKKEDLSFAGDEALQNLASSWGPFQVMGYKCLLMDIKVKDLRGENSVFWGTQWISETYGKYLIAKDYKSAFHIHNAGTPYPKIGKPKTYNPNYVKDGLEWMVYFKSKL